MKTPARKYSSCWIPVLIRQVRQQPYCPQLLARQVAEAREELKAQESEVLARRHRFMNTATSRALVKHVLPCFDCEERAILLALEATSGLEAFLRSGHPGYLQEAQSDYTASELQLKRLVRMRKQMPWWFHEALQKAA
jgi:hypothetical protein